jgi:hypothetical protein
MGRRHGTPQKLPHHRETRTAQARTVAPGTFPLNATLSLRDLTTPSPAPSFTRLFSRFLHGASLTSVIRFRICEHSPSRRHHHHLIHPSHNSAKRLHYRPRLRSTRAASKRKKHWTAAAARHLPISPSGALRARCDGELSCGKCVGDLHVGFSRSRPTLPRQHTVPARRRSWS